MLKIIPNKKNIGAEIIVNLKDITNKDILKINCKLLKLDDELLNFAKKYNLPVRLVISPDGSKNINLEYIINSNLHLHKCNNSCSCNHTLAGLDFDFS